MKKTDLVVVHQHDKVRVLMLNRPERRNALGMALMYELDQALKYAMADHGTNVIVLRGAGAAFCAGKDLKEHEQNSAGREKVREEIALLHDISRQILFSEKPVIAGVHGWAVGGGLELMLNCDLVILEQDARMFFPEIALGLFVTCGVSAILPRMIGLARSRAMLMTGEHIDAQQALAMGMVWKVYDSAEFDQKLFEDASALASMPQESLREMKKVIADGLREEIESALQSEAEIAEHCALGEDARKIIAAKLAAD